VIAVRGRGAGRAKASSPSRHIVSTPRLGEDAFALPAPRPPNPKITQTKTQALWLFGILAVATIIWGVLTGSYFGIATERLPEWLRGIPWLHDNSNIMWLCFIIAVVHLSVAHLWNAIVLFPSLKFLSQVGWMFIMWTLFSLAGNLVVGHSFPPYMLYLGIAGFVLVVLFMTAPRDLKNDWINHPMLALSIVSALVDIISYIRLFAVGMAAAQIALSFNEMAMGLSMPMWQKIPVFIFILLIGHGLNIFSGVLAILVHGVRLNILEFSSHKGLTWSGQPYTPFTKE